MKKNIALVTLVALGVQCMMQAKLSDWFKGSDKNASPQVAAGKSSSMRSQSYQGHHKMTNEERLSRAQSSVSDHQAIVSALKATGFATKNPTAFARAEKALKRSEHHLSNVKSGKKSRHHRRHHYRAHNSKGKTKQVAHA